MIRIGIQDGAFHRDFQYLIARARNPVGMLLGSGRQLSNELIRHFRAKDVNNPNEKGGKRTHFWRAVSQTVSQPFQSGFNSISVSIGDPRFAQKVFGGTITAKRGKMLTIPLTAEAYGHVAADFPGLFLLVTPRGAYLVKHGETFTATKGISEAKVGKYRIRANLNFLFKLVPSVFQKPDPTALPPQSQLETAILARAQTMLDREIRKP